jgi:hypothetical protein
MPIHLIVKGRFEARDQRYITFKSIKNFLKSAIADDFLNSIIPEDFDEEKLEHFLVS